MSIKKYTNIESINNKTDNEGQFLQSDDLFIVTKNEIEETDFGDCKYDVMEVSVYDVNNNLLPNKSGKSVAYIKTGDIKNYMYNLTNKGGQKELAIDVEKLLNDLGFTNGILKINVNFVRNKVGSENELTKVWIHEISPSRTEVRIIPLKVSDNNVSNINKKQFLNLSNLNKDFKYYKKNILDALDSFELEHLDSVTNHLVNRFGNDFQAILKKDFGLSNFDSFKKRIFNDFKDSVTHYLNNRYYDVTQSNFGKKSEIRFENCEQYDFDKITTDISSILNNCISANTKTLKRRDVTIKTLPKEFEITELKKEVKDLVGDISIKENKVRNVFSNQNVVNNVKGTSIKEEPIEILPPPQIKVDPIEEIKDTPIEIVPKPLPIIPKEDVLIKDDLLPIKEEPLDIIEPIKPTTSGGGGGGGGYYYPVGYESDMNDVIIKDMKQRENIK